MTRDEWFRLPLKLRQRYWRETNYSERAPSPELADLLRIYARLAVFYDAAEIERWLDSKHPLLDGKRAADLIAEGKTQEVHRVIDQLESGAYL